MLQIEKFSLKKDVTLASTYMNISAVLSHMNRHREALKIAKKANGMFLDLKEKQLNGQNPYGSDSSVQHTVNGEGSFQINLIISYFNMGIAAERLGSKKEAFSYINQGYHFAMIDLGTSHAVTGNMRNYLENLSAELKRNQPVTLPAQKDRYSSHSRSQHEQTASLGPRSTSVGDNSVQRAKTINIDPSGRHRLILQRGKDEISIAQDYFLHKKLPKPKLAKPKSRNLSKDKSQSQSRKNELTMLLEELAERKQADLKRPQQRNRETKSGLSRHSLLKEASSTSQHKQSQPLQTGKKLRLEPVNIHSASAGGGSSIAQYLGSEGSDPNPKLGYKKLGSLLVKLSNSDLTKLPDMIENLDVKQTLKPRQFANYESEGDISSIAVQAKKSNIDIANSDIALPDQRASAHRNSREAEVDLSKNLIVFEPETDGDPQPPSVTPLNLQRLRRSRTAEDPCTPQEGPDPEDFEEYRLNQDEIASEELEEEPVLRQHSDANSGMRLRTLNQKYRPQLGDIAEEPGSLAESKALEGTLRSRSNEKYPDTGSKLRPSQARDYSKDGTANSVDQDSADPQPVQVRLVQLEKPGQPSKGSLAPSDGTSGEIKFSKSESSKKQVRSGHEFAMTGNFNMKRVVTYNVSPVRIE